ncbi:tetratricopeptide repeat protein [Sulfurospirillum sp. 1307]
MKNLTKQVEKYIKVATDNFFDKKYDVAMLNFSLALELNPNSQEAKIGAILCDFAHEKEEEAIAIFEYYLVNKSNGVENSESIVEDILNSVDFTLETLEKMFFEESIEENLNTQEAIGYDDFKSFIKSKNSFKEAFEDIMFSTKVIIHKRDDFIDFLEQLIDNGFEDMSLNYFESAVNLFPNDEKLLSLIKKVQNSEN